MCYSFKVFCNLTVHKVFVIEYAKLISLCLAGSEYATVPPRDTGGFLRRRILIIGLKKLQGRHSMLELFTVHAKSSIIGITDCGLWAILPTLYA